MNSETCPKCQFPKLSVTAQDCPRCGIVFARYRGPGILGFARPRRPLGPPVAPQARAAVDENPFAWVDGEAHADMEALPRQALEPLPEQAAPPSEPPAISGMPHLEPPASLARTAPNRISWLTTGLGLAVVAHAFPLLKWIFGTLGVLIHELGHATFAWAFGRPAIPALDPENGGGVTSTFAQSPLLVVLIAVLIYVPFAKQRKVAGVNRRAGLCIGLYLGIAFSPVSEVLLTVGGHGLVLISIVYCLYQVLCQKKFKTPLDPPLYATIGFFNVFHLVSEFWQLATDSGFRGDYELKTGGPSDFMSLSESLGVGVAPLAWLALLAVLATPPLAFLLYRKDAVWRAWLHDRYTWLTGRT